MDALQKDDRLYTYADYITWDDGESISVQVLEGCTVSLQGVFDDLLL